MPKNLCEIDLVELIISGAYACYEVPKERFQAMFQAAEELRRSRPYESGRLLRALSNAYGKAIEEAGLCPGCGEELESPKMCRYCGEL